LQKQTDLLKEQVQALVQGTPSQDASSPRRLFCYRLLGTEHLRLSLLIQELTCYRVMTPLSKENFAGEHICCVE
jgi:hypothetical protein